MTNVIGNMLAVVDQVIDTAAKKQSSKKQGSKVAPITGDFTSIAAECGMKLAESLALQRDADMRKEEVNKLIKKLHDSKIEVGRIGKCSLASAFSDALMNAGISKGTAQNYCSVFRKAVESGKAVMQWNVSRDTDTAKAKKTRNTKDVTLADKLLPAFNFGTGEEFKALCFKIEAAFLDAKIDCFYSGIIQYLESEGVEMDKGEKKNG